MKQGARTDWWSIHLSHWVNIEFAGGHIGHRRPPMVCGGTHSGSEDTLAISETLDRQNSETSFKNWPPVDAGMCDCVSHPLNVPWHPFGPQCASICYSRPSFEEDRQGGWSAKQLVDRSPKVVLAKPNRATGQAKWVKGAKSRILIDEHFQMLYMQTYSALNICHGAIQAYQLLGTL